MKILVVTFIVVLAATQAVLFLNGSLRSRVHGYLARHYLLTFIVQTAKSIFFIVAIFTLLAGVPDQPAEAAWLFIYLLPVILGGIIWFTIWLWRRHGGSAVLSVVGAVLVLSGIQYAFMQRDAERAVRAVPNETGALGGGITAVDLSEVLSSCDHQLCIEVLAETNYDVLLRDGTYRVIRDAACYAAEYEASHLRFLKAGYAGTCYRIVENRKPGRQLIIEDRYCREKEREDTTCDPLPRSFSGRVVTIRIESPENSRIVRRWLEGAIRPANGWFALVGLQSMPVGKRSDHAELLTRALDVEIEGFGVRHGGDLDLLLTELEAFLNKPSYADQALQALWSVSDERGREDREILKAHIARLIEAEDDNHILAGLKLVTHRSGVDVRYLQPRIVQLSQSSDARIKDFAERALRHIEHSSPSNSYGAVGAGGST
jgi:hypothetical protein